MLRVAVDPFRREKYLQIAEHMPDHEQEQDQAGNRDNDFPANRRPAERADDAGPAGRALGYSWARRGTNDDFGVHYFFHSKNSRRYQISD